MQECHMHCIHFALVPRVLQVYKFKRHGMVQNARLGLLGMMVQKTNGPLAWMTKDMPPCGVLPQTSPLYLCETGTCVYNCSTSISIFNTYQMMIHTGIGEQPFCMKRKIETLEKSVMYVGITNFIQFHPTLQPPIN